ncbi:putative peptidylprolyl isomerase [Helianthus debilis subsp. tardiflorus]
MDVNFSIKSTYNDQGIGGESIYGGTFQAERGRRRRSGPSILMTLSQGGSDATGSQFVLCYRQSTDFEGDNTIFGRVIKGMDTVLELQMMGRGTTVEIVDCGEVSGDYASESDSDKLSRFAGAPPFLINLIASSEHVTFINPSIINCSLETKTGRTV